ncbi:hypothetical protein [Parashewanella tropica]|uniref:hypothetical protein n=1 Tax=Parashewanella tropica TaxID=2547970 RepID=UPI0014790C17|nr:hypothetical protein [Parashewanella tropica]
MQSNNHQQLASLLETINKLGAETDFGCHHSELKQYIDKIRLLLPYKRYCVVTDWFLWG